MQQTNNDDDVEYSCIVYETQNMKKRWNLKWEYIPQKDRLPPRACWISGVCALTQERRNGFPSHWNPKNPPPTPF